MAVPWRCYGIRRCVPAAASGSRSASIRSNCPRSSPGGTLPFLEAGESRTYDLEFDVLTDADEFAALLID